MEPVVFTFKNRDIRQVTINDEPGFVAKDVAEALGYKWAGIRTVQHIPEEWRGVESVSTPSGNQDMHVITEQGLYFFLGRSDKQAAIPFQKWLAGDVLPAIRKTGVYASSNEAPKPVWEEPSYQQCEQCEKETKQIIWTIQRHLLSKSSLWNNIRKYHQLNLSNKEIATLVHLSPASLRRQMKAMRECGLLCPRTARELARMTAIDVRHRCALPSPYGILAQQGKQLQLFPMGALR